MTLGAETNTLLSGIFSEIQKQTRTLEEEYELLEEELKPSRNVTGMKTSAQIRREKRAADEEAKQKIHQAKVIRMVTRRLSDLDSSSEEYNQILKKSANSLKKAGVKLPKEMNRTFDKMLNNGKIFTGELEAFNTGLEEVGESANVTAKESIKTAQATHKYRLGIQATGKAMKDFVDRYGTAAGAVASLGASIKLAADQINESTRRQVPLMDLTAGGLEDMAAMYGISSKEMMAVTDDYTNVMLANAKQGTTIRGAAHEYLGAFAELRDQARDLTGSYEEGNRLVVSSFSALSRLGMDTTFKDLQGPASNLMKSMQSIARITGRSAEEESKMLEMMMKEDSMRRAALQLGKQERLNFLQKIAQDKLLFMRRGMEIEQAEEAAKALGKLTTEQDPREIYSNAARLASVAGALGIEGGQKFMQEMMKPAAQRDTAFLTQFATEFERAQQAALGEGVTGKSMQAFSMISRAQGPTMDLLKTISTAGLEGRTIEDKTFDAATEQTTLLTGIQDELKEGIEVWQRVEPFLKEPSALAISGFGAFALSNIGLLKTIAANTMSIGKGAGSFMSKQRGLGPQSKAGFMGKSRGGGIGTLAVSAAAVTYAVSSAWDLIKSGGETSAAYESAKEIFPEIDKNLGGWLASLTDFDEQQAEEKKRMDEARRKREEEQYAGMSDIEIDMQKRMLILMERSVDVQEAHRMVSEKMRSEGKELGKASYEAAVKAGRYEKQKKLKVNAGS